MKKISEKKIIDNGYRSVYERIFELDNGKTASYLVSGHNGGPDSVTVLARTKEKKFILIDEYRVGPERVIRTGVLGGCETAYTIEENARKELLEETGYEGGDTYLIGKIPHSPYHIGMCHFFFIDGVEKGSEERHDIWIHPVFLSQEELEKQLLDGKIECTHVISLYYLAKAKTHNFTNFNF